MIEAHYWWDEAARFRECARFSEDTKEQTEFLELAEACEAVAMAAEERATGG